MIVYMDNEFDTCTLSVPWSFLLGHLFRVCETRQMFCLNKKCFNPYKYIFSLEIIGHYTNLNFWIMNTIIQF